MYETPATDPSSIVGRTVEVFAPQLTGDKTRSHIKLLFRVDEVKEKSATTQFYGLECLPEYVYRNIRAGLQKLEAIDTVDTKDNWKLQITASYILNSQVNVNIQKNSRKFIINFLKAEAAKSTLEEFVKSVVAGAYQKKIKKDGSRVYPVRFLEISKIEVVNSGKAS